MYERKIAVSCNVNLCKTWITSFEMMYKAFYSYPSKTIPEINKGCKAMHFKIRCQYMSFISNLLWNNL